MQTQGSQKRGCFQLGCIGCGGVAVLMFLVTMLPVALIGLDDRRASQEFPRLDSDLPEGFELNPITTGTDATEGDYPEFALEPNGSGRVVIDFAVGEFEIIPGDPGEPIRIEGDYDQEKYELKIGFEETGDGDWVFGLSFAGPGRIVNPEEQRVTLILPAGVPFVLLGEIGIGESSVELGGLAVTAVDLELGSGQHEISFSETSPVPMDSFRAEGSVGQMIIGELGNARPRSAYVSHRTGQLTVDLGGVWRITDDGPEGADTGSEDDIPISIRGGIGQTLIHVPDSATTRLEDTSWMLGELNTSALEDLPEPGTENLPTLSLSVSQRVGELKFDQ